MWRSHFILIAVHLIKVQLSPEWYVIFTAHIFTSGTVPQYTNSNQAYGSSRIMSGKIQQILDWPGSFETFRKIPTCLLYDDDGQILYWGLEAKNAGSIPYTHKCEWWEPIYPPGFRLLIQLWGC